jgi:hypothetical protein
MKTVIKVAVGATIAGALVSLLVKRQSSERLSASNQDPGDPSRSLESVTLQELDGENAEWGGDSCTAW